MGRFWKNLSIYASAVFLLFGNFVDASANRRIKLEDGYYNGILIGIDGERIDANECVNLKARLEAILPEFSNLLYKATSGKAGIGKVDVLLPQGWIPSHCGLPDFVEAPPTHSYQSAAIQVTRDHPFAKTLPWTRQYKPCGQGGDSIIIPDSFLSDFESPTNAQLLLHEWAKFRYGVFEEYGYDGGENEQFPPCYSRNNQGEMTCCTGSRISTVAGSASECSVKLLMGQRGDLTEQLSQSQSSVMSSPFIHNVSEFCNQSTHNPWASSKQNAYCNRKSISEVMYGHVDFGNVSPIEEWKPPEIRFVRHQSVYTTAYAFVVENSPEMIENQKLVYVKQAIAQFLEMLNIDTEVAVINFSSINTTAKRLQIRNDGHKIEILSNISNSSSSGTVTQLVPVMSEVVRFLQSSGSNVIWNVVLITSAVEKEDMPAAIEEFQRSSNSISILTYDSSSDWLQWNSIANTKSVIVLPHHPGNLQTSAFIVDHLCSLLGEREKPRTVQKVVQQALPQVVGHAIRFQLPEVNSKAVFFFVTVSQSLTTEEAIVKLTHIATGASCEASLLLKYPYLAGNSKDCTFNSGTWTATVTSRISGVGSVFHAFVEYGDLSDPLVVVPSLGIQDPTQGIYPSTNNLTIAFVSVMSGSSGWPVIGAEVSVQVYHTSSLSGGQTPKPRVIKLWDNGQGNGADQTTNDGVYSGYLTEYADIPSFHFLQVTVSTDTVNSKIVKSINSPEAALLDEKMRGKCCGKTIVPFEAQNLAFPLHFQFLTSGFKTLGPGNQRRLPPAIIDDQIRTSEESDTSKTIQFRMVNGDTGGDENVVVSSIQACCVPTDDTLNNVPSAVNCKPNSVSCGEQLVPPGELQSCTLDKKTLVNLFVSEGDRQKFAVLGCALRAVNTNSEVGQLSTNSFDVNVREAIQQVLNKEPECKRISDGCLPMWVFWVLIGCVALLLAVILLILICCWCRSRRQTSKCSSPVGEQVKSSEDKDKILSVHYQSSPRPPPKSPAHSSSEPKMVKELFINNAYIQDGDGEIKIIADNGQILRKSKENGINNVGVTRGIKQETIRTPVQTVVVTPTHPPQLPSPEDDMQIFKPVAQPRPKTIRTQQPQHQQQQQHQQRPTLQKNQRDRRPDIVHSNPMLRSDSSFMSPPHHEPPPPQSSSRIDPSIVYASVSRAGRLKPIITPGKASTLPRKQVSIDIDPHYQVPHNAAARTPIRRRDPLPNPEPPPIQRYPSTDSDSSMPVPLGPPGVRSKQHYHGKPRYNNPPPYPAGSQLVNRSQSSTFSVPPPSPTPVLPPVPPPRVIDRGGGVSTTGQRSSIQNFSPKQDLSSTDEDDSDQWDDGEQFEFPTGVSYA